MDSEQFDVKIVFLDGTKEVLHSIISSAFIPESSYIGFEDEKGKKYYYNLCDISRFFLCPD